MNNTNSDTIEKYNDQGQLHCDDGPAILYKNGDKSYYKNGKRHREDGPAIEWSSINEYYIDNILYTKEQFLEKTKKKKDIEKFLDEIINDKPSKSDNVKPNLGITALSLEERINKETKPVLKEDVWIVYNTHNITYNPNTDKYYLDKQIEGTTSTKEIKKKESFLRTALNSMLPFRLFLKNSDTHVTTVESSVIVPKEGKQIIKGIIELDNLQQHTKYFDYYLLNNIYKHCKYVVDTYESDFVKPEHEHKLNVLNLVQFDYYYLEHINDFLHHLRETIIKNKTNYTTELNIKKDKLKEYQKELDNKNTRGLKTKIKNITLEIKNLKKILKI
jgi:hypothetical protein